MITVSALNALSNVRHGFFTREGGVSTGIYGSRNCGFGSGDDPMLVTQNRDRCMDDLERVPEALVTPRQQHTSTVVVVERAFSVDQAPVADALVTNRPRIALGILTADCAPVLFADNEAGIIAAAHAGWRGALNGILDETIKAMVGLGATPKNIVAGIGPCIAQRSYEVGPEFPAPFLAETPDNQQFFATAAREGHFMFDLPGYIARRLALQGVGEIMPTPCDTLRDSDRFFSFRRNTLAGEKAYGRQLSAIALEH